MYTFHYIGFIDTFKLVIAILVSYKICSQNNDMDSFFALMEGEGREVRDDRHNIFNQILFQTYNNCCPILSKTIFQSNIQILNIKSLGLIMNSEFWAKSSMIFWGNIEQVWSILIRIRALIMNLQPLLSITEQFFFVKKFNKI